MKNENLELDEILNSLTGQEYIDLEEQLGCPISEIDKPGGASSTKLMLYIHALIKRRTNPEWAPADTMSQPITKTLKELAFLGKAQDRKPKRKK